MRTTVNIDEHVLARAKDEARRLGITLGEYLSRAVQRELAAPTETGDDAPLPVYRGRLLIPLERMSNAEIQDFLDEGVPLDKLR